jgi:hypothetical protein
MRLNKAVLDVVENQIRRLNPPATKETLDRLIREGHDQAEARRLIGAVVASEIFDILKNMEPRTDMWLLFGNSPNCPNDAKRSAALTRITIRWTRAAGACFSS